MPMLNGIITCEQLDPPEVHIEDLYPMPERPTDKRERYVAYSAYCLKLAKVAFDNQSRVILREMASEWLTLAEQSCESD
jgi:hypothetical protein